VSSDPIAMCELLVGLPDVIVLEVGDRLRVVVETRGERLSCPGCGGPVAVKDRTTVELTDLPCFGRRAVLAWRKFRWACLLGCGSFTEQAAGIAAPRLKLTDRAGRWATVQVGRHGRSVTEVAADLGCGWHAVMDAVTAYGRALVDDPARFGDVWPKAKADASAAGGVGALDPPGPKPETRRGDVATTRQTRTGDATKLLAHPRWAGVRRSAGSDTLQRRRPRSENSLTRAFVGSGGGI
jgi:zinc-finger of transposase IS204/IS1001/IS1096/IS1165